MAQAKRKWIEYPKYQGGRVGCKVSWYYYADKADAEAASKAAKSNAILLEGRGYDFGYQVPGSIKLIDAKEGWPEDARGMYEVCLP